jgi:PAS domain-containing protein
MAEGSHPSWEELVKRVQALEALVAEIDQAKEAARKAEETLARTEQVLLLRERVLESIAEGILVMDAARADRAVVRVNPAVERIAGVPFAQMLGRPGAEFLGQPQELGHRNLLRVR